MVVIISLEKFDLKGDGFFIRGAESGTGLFDGLIFLFESTEVAEARRIKLFDEFRFSLLLDYRLLPMTA